MEFQCWLHKHTTQRDIFRGAINNKKGGRLIYKLCSLYWGTEVNSKVEPVLEKKQWYLSRNANNWELAPELLTKSALSIFKASLSLCRGLSLLCWKWVNVVKIWHAIFIPYPDQPKSNNAFQSTADGSSTWNLFSQISIFIPFIVSRKEISLHGSIFICFGFS